MVNSHMSTFSHISESDRRRLANWNATKQAYPRSACVPELVAKQAAAIPEAVALIAGSQRLTYAELNRRANQLAHYLQKLEVRTGALVGLCTERSLDMIVGLLGILKAGAAYVPLDPNYPPERLAFMLGDAQTPILVTQRSLVAQLPTMHGIEVVCLGEDVLSQQSTDDPTTPIMLDDLAYVIYTSGSTGQPKGVQISHESLLNVMFWYQRTFGLTSADRSSQLMSLAFDPTVGELWPFLTLGATVTLCDEVTRLSPLLLHDWLIKNQITVTTLPMALTEQMMKLVWPATTTLRYIISGGDTLHHYPSSDLPFAICNCYGLTETTITATYEIVSSTEDPTTPPPIGRAIANVETYILDEQLHEVPIGEVGELYIGGICLARGYLNQPELTKAKFIPHPFSDTPGARLCRTGDQARYLQDGRIAFLGRADYQIKIRGHRIEPDEIMAALSKHPAIRQGLVIAREDTPGDKRLVAYIMLASGTSISVASLQALLKVYLPEYMIPTVFVPMETLPLTPNGKLDRAALPVPNPANTLRDEVEPQTYTPTQKRVGEIAASLLKLGQIGLDENLFLLGAHSLLSTQIIARIAESFGIDLSLQTLFEAPTVRQLADKIEEQTHARTASAEQDQSISQPTTRRPSPMVPVASLQTNGSKPPFFYIHVHVEGGAFYTFRLAQILGEDQPFYVLNPYKLEDQPIPPPLETIATAYIESLRSIQPEGPYFLGGFCGGALIAFEVAHQLRKAGQEVAFLALVEATGGPALHRMRFRRRIGNMVRSIGWLLHLSQVQQGNLYAFCERERVYCWQVYDYLRIHFRRLQNTLGLDSEEHRAHGRIGDNQDPKFPGRKDLGIMGKPIGAFGEAWIGKFSWMTSHYEVRQYPGKITYFWAAYTREQELLHIRRNENGEVPEAKKVENCTLPGNHHSIRNEHVDALAEGLKKYLVSVQESLDSNSTP